MRAPHNLQVKRGKEITAHFPSHRAPARVITEEGVTRTKASPGSGDDGTGTTWQVPSCWRRPASLLAGRQGPTLRRAMRTVDCFGSRRRRHGGAPLDVLSPNAACTGWWCGSGASSAPGARSRPNAAEPIGRPVRKSSPISTPLDGS